ncbi:hypothetical protein BOH78_4281 [Pichia kudriavzevii]|uniref:Uncharacterized protein n=1 Tax=Pichia kudriavzevii TaxID=4909 RepID=A0A1V2LET0_PICKU|nr:hypothetical protein BOH78_5468 [Pichia kudriavzevii]ONH70248.1 hypothetical protein BOH78_5384 [Pichia kudriavzevii]ONH70355.1 hypothetical protein BOH78_5280 [Pichia kudriavzevii]ONH70393.1 hypothetical protein BOH78_5247 [Pichia kudriavzevii]ONH70598.1 hypothetical protein BOH78_5108 [Pichia kudriavzevii]
MSTPTQSRFFSRLIVLCRRHFTAATLLGQNCLARLLCEVSKPSKKCNAIVAKAHLRKIS